MNSLFLLSKSGLAITIDEFKKFSEVSDNLIKSLPVVKFLIFISSTSNFLLEGKLNTLNGRLFNSPSNEIGIYFYPKINLNTDLIELLDI